MPKQTFFNLPDEKRRVLVEIAIDEFGQHDYMAASVSRIVAKAGIAKGSLYQYFEDKKDLYLYLLELAGQEKLAFLGATPPPDPKMGLFPYLRWMVRAGVQFQLANPRLARVSYRAVYGYLPFKDELLGRVKGMALEYFRDLVKQGVAQGDIDPGVDPELAAFVMNTVSTEFGFYIMGALKLDPEQLANDGLKGAELEAIERLYDGLLQILEHGLGKEAADRGHGDRGDGAQRTGPRTEKEATR